MILTDSVEQPIQQPDGSYAVVLAYYNPFTHEYQASNIADPSSPPSAAVLASAGAPPPGESLLTLGTTSTVKPTVEPLSYMGVNFTPVAGVTAIGGTGGIMTDILGGTTGILGSSAAILPLGGATGGVSSYDYGVLQPLWDMVYNGVMQFWNNGLVQKAIALIKSVFGVGWVKKLGILVAAGGIAVWLWNWLRGGSKKRHHKRLSIGSNPRIATLIRVGKRTDKLTRMFGSRMRHAGLIHSSYRHNYYGMPGGYRMPGGRKDLTIVR